MPTARSGAPSRPSCRGRPAKKTWRCWFVMLENVFVNGTVSRNANSTWTPGSTTRSSFRSSISSRSSRSSRLLLVLTHERSRAAIFPVVEIRELMKLEVDPAEVQAILRALEAALDRRGQRDLPGLIATLTDDCVYEIVGTPAALGGPRRRNALLHRSADRLPGHPLRPDGHRRRPAGRRRGGGGNCDARAGVAGLGAERRAGRVPRGDLLSLGPGAALFRGEKVYVHADGLRS